MLITGSQCLHRPRLWPVTLFARRRHPRSMHQHCRVQLLLAPTLDQRRTVESRQTTFSKPLGHKSTGP